MRKTLYQLAYRNLKKYKKHYFIVSFIALFVSLFFMTYVMTWENHYDVEKMYNQKTYGNWYLWLDVEEDEIEIIEEIIHKQKTYPTYGYYYDQGKDAFGHQIAYLDNHLYEMCHLKLIDGRYPQNDHEIMVSSKLLQKQGYQLYDTISLTLQELQDYEIVGVIENSQDIFPDIYTNKTVGDIQFVADGTMGVKENGYCTLYETPEDRYNGIGYSLKIVYENKFGYDVNVVRTHIDFNIEQIIVLTEVFLFIMFVIGMLTSSSLQKRNQEFALLRGIGMTSRQLFTMVFYETLWTSLLSVVIGTIISIFLSYGLMLYFEGIYHEFVFQFQFGKIIGLFLLLVGLILVSSLYPIFSSANQALSGAFGGRRFEYIQIRYRQLKKQTKIRLAYRELMSCKKITFSFLFLTCMLMITITSISFKNIPDQISEITLQTFHYIQLDTANLENKDVLKIHEKYKDISHVFREGYLKEECLFQNQIFNRASVMALDDLDVLENCVIDGRLPQNNHEIMISSYRTVYLETNSEFETDLEPVTHLKLGEKLIINQQEYEIVGNIEYNEEVCVQDFCTPAFYLPSYPIYMMPKEFDSYFSEYQNQLRFYTDSTKENQELIKELRKKYKDIQLYALDETIDYSETSDIQISPVVYILPLLALLMICYFVNKNYIINNHSNYALYRLLGTTKKEMLVKQLLKAGIMTFYIVGVEIFWLVLVNINNESHTISYVYLLVSTFIIFIFYMIVYCLPYLSLMKEDLMTYLVRNE